MATLSDSDCKLVLQSYLQHGEWELHSHTSEALSSVNGFMGQHFTVGIAYRNKGDTVTRQFFMKQLNSSLKYAFDVSLSFGAYDKEEFFYVLLMRTYELNKIDTSYAPKCYFCRPHLLVLEDVSQRGFRSVARRDMFDVEHCRCALTALAKFHASSVVFEEIASEKLGTAYSLFSEYREHLDEKLFSKYENTISIWFRNTLQGIFDVIQDQVTGEEFVRKLRDAVERCYDVATPSSKFRNVILHGDVWSNNFLFRYNDDGMPQSCILVDYQLLKYGSPALEVVTMIFTNVRRTLRIEHFDEFLEKYYESFSEYLARYGLVADDVLSKKDFLLSCQDVRQAAMIDATADHTFTFLPDEILQSAFRSDGAFEKFMTHGRRDDITSSYKTDRLFRKILDDDICSIKDFLFKL